MNDRKNQRLILILAAALLLLCAASLLVGRYPRPPGMPPALLWKDELARSLVFNLRLPRIIAAVCLGMALSASGAVMQMLFRNPLVEPGFLGVTQGAAFGAALSILYIASSAWVVEASAAVFAIAGLVFSYLLARNLRFGGWVLRLVLSGIAVSALFSAGLGILKYLADPASQLPEIVFWLLGGLYTVTWRDLLYLLPVVIPGLVVILLMRWRLNLLALNEETAASLGIPVKRERTLLLFAAVAVTAVMVSVAGIVGWIGLIMPHIARRIAGTNSANAIPLTILLGGIFSLLCDNLARTLLPGEIPLGILSSLFGALIFIVLMVSRSLKVER